MNKNNKQSKFNLLSTSLVGMLLFSFPSLVFAQSQVSAGTRVLQIFGILGLIGAIIGVVYGVTILRNANQNNDILMGERGRRAAAISGIVFFIMLILVLISFFVLGRGTVDDQSGTQADITPEGSASLLTRDSLILSEALPFGSIPIQNPKVQLLFNQAVDQAVVEQMIQVVKQADQQPIQGNWTTDGAYVTFTPQQSCASPNESLACFQPSTIYEVTIALGLTSQDGDPFKCSLETSADECIFRFETGEEIDAQRPSAKMTLPYDQIGVPFDSAVLMEAIGRDNVAMATLHFFANDTRVAVASVASGESVLEFRGAGNWDTSGLGENETYELFVQAIDLAGNRAQSSAVTVEIVPLFCFDDQQNQDEEAIDCGGETCRSCEGTVCSVNADCASGLCFDGICREFPVVQEVIDPDGATGNYVTIRGQNFGELPGAVVFMGNAGNEDDLIALIPQCEVYWTNTEVVVEVPEGVQDGPIRLTTGDGLFDVTDDNKGALIEFFASEDIRPRLCPPVPSKGTIGETIDLIGNGFRNEIGQVLFGQYRTETSEIVSWSDQIISEITIPQVDPGQMSIRIDDDNERSNPVFFTAEPSPILPRLSSIAPDFGPAGQMITLGGENFDQSLSGFFINIQTGERTPLETRLDNRCAPGQTSKQRAVRVPRVDPGNYQVVVLTDAGESNIANFRVTDGERIPGVCAVIPDNGPAGVDVTFIGEDFGDAEGGVRFSPRIDDTLLVGWSRNEVNVVAPAGIQTGPIQLYQPDGTLSNAFEFTVGQCSPDTCEDGFECCGDGSCRKAGTCVDSVAYCTYSWVFSTGDDLNGPPRVIEEASCRNTTQSPSPYIGTTDACLNAAISARFTHDMRDETLRPENITLRRCNSGEALNIESCTGAISLRNLEIINAGQPGEGFFTNPNGQLEPNTWYQVELSTAFIAENGQSLASPYTWTFRTQPSNTQCAVDHIEVLPSSTVINQIGDTQTFNGIPTALNCNILDPDAYQWTWLSGDTGKVTLSNTRSSQTNARGVAPTEPGPAVDVIAEIPQFSKEDSGKVTVRLLPPRVTQQFPDCKEACPNAVVGAIFDQEMDKGSVLASVNSRLYKCGDASCARSGLEQVGIRSPRYNAESLMYFFLPQTALLEQSAHYRVVLSGNMRSVSGIGLAGLNYDENSDGLVDSYSWVFKVKDEGELCELDRVTVVPDEVVSGIIGEEFDYVSFPTSKPDACNAEGQLLNPESFGWAWETASTDIASITQEDLIAPQGIVDPYQIAESVGEGATTIEATAEGVTGSGDFRVVCGYETANDCPDPATPQSHGIGDNSCCYERPSIVSIVPKAGADDVCTTAMTEVQFNQEMDAGSLVQNLILEVDNGTEPCPGQTVEEPQTDESTVWNYVKGTAKKILHWIIPSLNAQATNWCKVPYAVNTTENEIGTLARVRPTEQMRPLTQHRVRIVGDDTIDDSVVTGVRNSAGVAYFGIETSEFTTNERECSVDLIETTITPPGEQGRVDAFFCAGRDSCPGDSAEGAPGNQHTYDAIARDITGYAVPAEYTWSVTEGADLISLNTETGESVDVTSGVENGQAGVTVNAIAVAPSTGEQSATIEVEVFICENPWPSIDDFPYSNRDYGYFTFYCRDFGEPGFDDDLPPLRDPVVGNNVGNSLQDSLFVVE